MPTPKEIQRLSYLKAIRLEKIINEVEKRIRLSSSDLTKSMLKFFLDKLTTENGRIKATLDRKTAMLFNQAFGTYSNSTRIDLLKSILFDINTIIEDNSKFYKTTSNASSVQSESIKYIVNRRLGIDADGKFIKNGYMASLVDDTGFKTDLQKHIFKEIFKSTGPEAFRKSLQVFIEGTDKRLGNFEKHYKTLATDVYAQLNSYTGALYAEKLNMKYFIYNGGLIKTSRDFCVHKNGHVFSNEEAEDWVSDPDLKAIPDKESYNWVIDRGGYNCRHTIDFIAKEVAFVLRPDLKDINLTNDQQNSISRLLGD